MGYYIQGPAKGKAEFIVENLNGKIVSQSEAKEAVDNGLGVIVVVNNGPFEAAGFAFDWKEFQDFTLFTDQRPKRFVIMDRKLACELSGFPSPTH